MWHFILTDRLNCYASKEGIAQSLAIMMKYRGLQVDPLQAIRILTEYENEWRNIFELFFQEMVCFCQRELE
jgi:hypothetical protein